MAIMGRVGGSPGEVNFSWPVPYGRCRPIKQGFAQMHFLCGAAKSEDTELAANNSLRNFGFYLRRMAFLRSI
jgi:hypothetical protein